MQLIIPTFPLPPPTNQQNEAESSFPSIFYTSLLPRMPSPAHSQHFVNPADFWAPFESQMRRTMLPGSAVTLCGSLWPYFICSCARLSHSSLCHLSFIQRVYPGDTGRKALLGGSECKCEDRNHDEMAHL